VANSRCIPSGVRSPTCSASCQPFLRPTLPSSPRRYASTRRRGSARVNLGAMRACRASSPTAHARTSSMSAAASLASGTIPPASIALSSAGPSPTGGREPYLTTSAAGVLIGWEGHTGSVAGSAAPGQAGLNPSQVGVPISPSRRSRCTQREGSATLPGRESGRSLTAPQPDGQPRPAIWGLTCRFMRAARDSNPQPPDP
jgi:hypothetical protein